GNHACYRSKTYDALYTQAIHLPPQQRLPYYEKLSRQIEADNPWIIHVTRIRNWLIRPQVQGFKPHPMINTSWQYLDITPVKK
ncbi:MAG TPA: heme-binding protein, partial [Acinetobacter nosocomialis]|nr:heme-binding protein [Acinetobacter nosocomialis]